MKKMIFAVLVVVLVATGAGAGEYGALSSELGASFRLWFPGDGDYDVYDLGYGVEAQYRIWFSEPFGVALAIGGASWQVTSDSTDLGVRLEDGSQTLLPVGVSLLFRAIDRVDWALTFDAGARYVMVNSDLKLARGEDVSVDDGIVGVAGLAFDRYLTEAWSLFVSGGYQLDLAKGEIRGGTLRDNELQAFYADLGVRLTF